MSVNITVEGKQIEFKKKKNRFPNCDPSKNHKAAFSAAAVAAQNILFHLPYDSDLTTRCGTLVTKLSHEAELTYKRVHGPIPDANVESISSSNNINVVGGLPSAEIVVTGSLHLMTDSQNEFEKLLSPTTAEGGSVTLFDRVAVRMVPLLTFDKTSPVTIFTKTDQSLDRLVESVTETLSIHHENSFWLHHGYSLYKIFDYSSHLTAPGIEIKQDSKYSTALKDFIQQKSVEKYAVEMTGVIERGWLIKTDGSTVIALPQVGTCNYVSEENATITTADFKSLRPPSTAKLEAFHDVVVGRLSGQVKHLLSRFAPEHIPNVISFITRHSSDAFETMSASNTNNIIRFVIVS